MKTKPDETYKSLSIVSLYLKMIDLMDNLKEHPNDVDFENYTIVMNRLVIMCNAHHNLTLLETIKMYKENNWIQK